MIDHSLPVNPRQKPNAGYAGFQSALKGYIRRLGRSREVDGKTVRKVSGAGES